ncbi:hypothetical protein Hanom_Chr11g01046891 [Helianthus anomalus]
MRWQGVPRSTENSTVEVLRLYEKTPVGRRPIGKPWWVRTERVRRKLKKNVVLRILKYENLIQLLN